MRPGFWPYLILRLRRVGKLFLPLLLVAALLMGGIGWFGVSLVRQDEAGAQRVEIGVVGDFEDSVLRMGMFALRNLDSSRFSIEFVQFSEESEAKSRLRAGKLNGYAGVVICPGFGQRGIPGKILATEYARTQDIPCFGICLGMQMMVIEFARNVLGYSDADSCEMNPQTPHNVIDLMEGQKNITQMGGTMRLGAYECAVSPGSRAYAAYEGHETVRERHRHRYEFNNSYLGEFEKKGMQCVGVMVHRDTVPSGIQLYGASSPSAVRQFH